MSLITTFPHPLIQTSEAVGHESVFYNSVFRIAPYSQGRMSKVVKIGAVGINETVEIPKHVMVRLSNLVKALSEFETDEEVMLVVVDVDTCKPTMDTLRSLREFVLMISSSSLSVFDVSSKDLSNDLSDHMTETELAFLNNHTNEELKRIMEVGCYLQMDTLCQLCGKWFAREFAKKSFPTIALEIFGFEPR